MINEVDLLAITNKPASASELLINQDSCLFLGFQWPIHKGKTMWPESLLRRSDDEGRIEKAEDLKSVRGT